MITWSEINARIMEECGDYRSAFVAIFREYQGQDTDEKDDRGRTVKVTEASFARHLGVVQVTFHRWVARANSQQPKPKPRSENDLTRDVKRATKASPAAVVEGILASSEEDQSWIFHELKLRRAGVDTSKAARKGASASARARTQRMRDSLSDEKVDLACEAWDEGNEIFKEALDEGAISDESMTKVDKRIEDIQLIRNEARYALS